MTVFPHLPYDLTHQMLVVVLTCVGVGVSLFVLNDFSINFGLSLKSLELFLVSVGSKSASTEVQLHIRLKYVLAVWFTFGLDCSA